MRTLVAIIVAVALTTAASGRIARASGSPSLYLALGDSLAEGFGASHPTLTAYVPRIFRYLHASANGAIDVSLNLGRGGESTTEMIGGGAPTSQLSRAVAAIADPNTDTQVVTIDIGGDDLLDDVLLANPACAADPLGQACFAALVAALSAFGPNFAYILATLNAALAAEDPQPERVFVFTYFNPWSGTGHPFEAPTDRLLLGTQAGAQCGDVGLNDQIACIAPLYGAAVVDLYPVFAGRALELTNIASGDIHPNDEGYAQIAAAFREVWRAG